MTLKKITLAFEPFMPEDAVVAVINFPDDCRRIQKALAKQGYLATELQASQLWAEYSENNFAGWLQLPTNDAIFGCVSNLIRQA